MAGIRSSSSWRSGPGGSRGVAGHRDRRGRLRVQGRGRGDDQATGRKRGATTPPRNCAAATRLDEKARLDLRPSGSGRRGTPPARRTPGRVARKLGEAVADKMAKETRPGPRPPPPRGSSGGSTCLAARHQTGIPGPPSAASPAASAPSSPARRSARARAWPTRSRRTPRTLPTRSAGWRRRSAASPSSEEGRVAAAYTLKGSGTSTAGPPSGGSSSSARATSPRRSTRRRARPRVVPRRLARAAGRGRPGRRRLLRRVRLLDPQRGDGPDAPAGESQGAGNVSPPERSGEGSGPTCRSPSAARRSASSRPRRRSSGSAAPASGPPTSTT
jgi:hypothetical protein